MQDERTLRMKQDFMSLHNQGLSIKEIAARFGLSVVTVYANLESIAKKEGCTRENLLMVVHAPHLTHDRQFEPVPEVDVDEYSQKFSELKNSTRELSKLIGKQILEMEGEE